LQGTGKLRHFGNTAELNTAIELFEKAIIEDPNFALAYAGLGDASLKMYSKTKDVYWMNKARENCFKADAINQNLAPVHITLGLLYIETGKYEEANKEFLIAQNIDPSNIDSYTGQATSYNKQGKLDEAESIFKKVIKMKPDYWSGYNHLGVFYYLQGKYKEAAQQFEEVVKLTPLNAGAFRNLGAMYYFLNQKADAIVMFKHSLEIEPDYSVYSNLATLYYYEGLYKDAALMYERALELQDTDYSVWGYLAGAYRQSAADSLKIIFALRKAKLLAEEQLKINPVDPLVLSNIASYCTELNLPDSALAIIKKVELLNPKDVNVMILIGEVYEQLGKRDKALAWIKKAIDNGYSVEELNHIPELKNLRADNRFEQIITKHK
jgi:tetratricopeptide (TPR) repeat protein